MTVVLHRTLLAAMVVAGFGRALPRWDHTAEVPAIASLCEAFCGVPGASSVGADLPEAAAQPALGLAPPRVVIADIVAIADSSVVVRPPLAVAPKTSPPVAQA
jgi:hypothetical protein